VSVRPIDIQMSIQRANEYTKEADFQNQKVNIHQFTNTREFQQVIDSAQRQVVPTGHVYHKRIDKEHDRRQRHSRYTRSDPVKDKKCNGTASSNKVEIKESDKGLSIDIRI